MSSSPIDEQVQALLLELFDTDMIEEWGWGQSFEPGRDTQTGLLSDEVIGLVLCGSLKIPYFGYSSVTVDLAAGTVICLAIDQKTPYEERWSLDPSPDWWERAKACPKWPVTKRTS